MLFNSLHFAVFLPIVFLLYWLLPKNKPLLQNGLLLLASYFFYACWDYRFLFLLFFSTVLDYLTGIKIGEATSEIARKRWLCFSISINLGLLGVFKYYNFFVTSFADALALLHIAAHLPTIQIILPIGISFYTFHGISYLIDIYKRRIVTEKKAIDYALFVSFFPLLVAGPIERATHLLPQLRISRTFDYTKTVDGLRQILWGLFKKVVVADCCAEYVNLVFGNTQLPGSMYLWAAILFSFQIYCDFSGYSDIAIGSARLFGINLLKNFDFPYFSRDIAEFWRRWHISLTSWLRDYIYIPLGGSRVSRVTKIRNVFIIFLVSGFWHGANWTFIVWGLLNALYILPSIVWNTNRNNLNMVAKGRILPNMKDFFAILSTFTLTTFAWIFFRATTLHQAIFYIKKILSKSIWLMPKPEYTETLSVSLLTIILLVVFFITIEWRGREQDYALARLGLGWHKAQRWLFYFVLISAIFVFNAKEQPFIYFQF
jgi:alginate O-acetyltransferase complex protein AlgI